MKSILAELEKTVLLVIDKEDVKQRIQQLPTVKLSDIIVVDTLAKVKELIQKCSIGIIIIDTKVAQRESELAKEISLVFDGILIVAINDMTDANVVELLSAGVDELLHQSFSDKDLEQAILFSYAKRAAKKTFQRINKNIALLEEKVNNNNG